MTDAILPRANFDFEYSYDWMGEGLCGQGDHTDLFFPDKRELEALAIRVCNTPCPVKKECYDYGVRTNAKCGIWGGVNFGGIKGRKPKVDP